MGQINLQPIFGDITEETIKQLQHIVNWWNDHNSGARTWDNMNATNSTIGTLLGQLIISIASGDSIKLHDTTNSQDTFFLQSTGSGTDDFILSVNRDPSTGTFTQTGQAGGSILIHSANGSGYVEIYASNTNNTAFTKIARFSITGTSIKGTNTNDSAAAGDIGEYVESIAAAVSAAATTQYSDITTISLTAGDWDVSMVMLVDGTGVTITGVWDGGISIGTAGNAFSDRVTASNGYNINPVAVPTNAWIIPSWRVSISATTTARMKLRTVYSAGTPSAYGRLSARRMR